MPETVGRDELAAMLRGAVREIKENHETLSALDSHGGDGDHGTSMVRAMEQVEKVLEEASSEEIKGLLNDIGWAVMGIDGGATGPLLGSLFMGMADEVEGKGKSSLDASALVAMFAAGLARVQKRTRAQVGDKTMIDALVPAVDALKEAVEEGAGVAAALERAAEAAQTGALSTKGLQARFGRARNLGERSIGEQDPGATSMALIFRGFSKENRGK
jgi:dihydroxyacetone kinase-like protein